MGEEMRAHFHEELRRLEQRTLDGLDLVVRALNRVLAAVRDRDMELAQLVIDDDDLLDGRYLEVHRELLALIATQAPVASDLRLVAALLHLIRIIERMGDQCVNVAKLIPLVGHDPPVDERLGDYVRRMGAQVRTLILQARRAFAERDVALARDLVRGDDLVDELNRECFRRAIAIGEDEDRREWAVTMILAGRALERIGDQAVDIGEQVAFLVTGLFEEFEDASHPEASRV